VEKEKITIKEILRTNILKHTEKMKEGDKIRRCTLKSKVLSDVQSYKTICDRICHGRKLTEDTVARRIDRAFSDALMTVSNVYVDYDDEHHKSWVVKDI